MEVILCISFEVLEIKGDFILFFGYAMKELDIEKNILLKFENILHIFS
jgi:hypothetical protein